MLLRKNNKMDKREFLKKAGVGSLALASGALLWGCHSDEKKEPTTTAAGPKVVDGLPSNWLWMRPKLEWSDDEWKKCFERVRAAGIEAVLPEVYNGNQALFDHPNFPVKARLLERLIPLAHQAGLQIHAWMWTMPLTNPEYKEKHPDWYAVNRKGESAHDQPAYVNYYNFLCPCHPEVPEFVKGNVEALAKIAELDGVHLDYVRMPDVILAEALQPKYGIVQDKEYPEYDYSYSKYCREQFKAQSGIDPMDLEDPASNEEWYQFRYDAISNVVNYFAVPTARKYDKMITAAVFPNWESVRQQWHKWALDAFLPMLYHGFYNEDVHWIKAQVEAARARLKDDKPVYSGLFVSALQPAELEQAIQLAKEGGAKGVSLFDYSALKEAHWEVMRKFYVE